ncbi:hypothetical protein ACLKA7_006038 [Drosophila subpalustris]
MGCCSSNLKLDEQHRLEGSIYASKRSRSGSSSSRASSNNNTNNHNNNNSSGLGSVWSRSQTTRPICDDFAERPMEEMLEADEEQNMDRSCGYHTCSSASAASTPSCERALCRTQDMEQNQLNETQLEPPTSNLEWEMFMMQNAQRLMPKTSSPICQRRFATAAKVDINSKSYHKWRNYLQSTPCHMLHNVSHIPEAIAGHFCPTDFPAFSDLEEMESAAKRFKVDTNQSLTSLPNVQIRQHLTHTISTDL